MDFQTLSALFLMLYKIIVYRLRALCIKIKEGGLDLFYFLFSIFRITRVRVDQSQCHISHNLIV